MSQEKEEAFRSSLEDVIVVLEKITPVCPQPEDLIQVLKIALDSPSQLRFLFGLVTAPKTAPKPRNG